MSQRCKRCSFTRVPPGTASSSATGNSSWDGPSAATSIAGGGSHVPVTRCPLCAKSGLMRCSKITSLDHLVGAQCTDAGTVMPNCAAVLRFNTNRTWSASPLAFPRALPLAGFSPPAGQVGDDWRLSGDVRNGRVSNSLAHFFQVICFCFLLYHSANLNKLTTRPINPNVAMSLPMMP